MQVNELRDRVSSLPTLENRMAILKKSYISEAAVDKFIKYSQFILIISSMLLTIVLNLVLHMLGVDTSQIPFFFPLSFVCMMFFQIFSFIVWQNHKKKRKNKSKSNRRQ